MSYFFWYHRVWRPLLQRGLHLRIAPLNVIAQTPGPLVMQTALLGYAWLVSCSACWCWAVWVADGHRARFWAWGCCWPFLVGGRAGIVFEQELRSCSLTLAWPRLMHTQVVRMAGWVVWLERCQAERVSEMSRRRWNALAGACAFGAWLRMPRACFARRPTGGLNAGQVGSSSDCRRALNETAPS